MGVLQRVHVGEEPSQGCLQHCGLVRLETLQSHGLVAFGDWHQALGETPGAAEDRALNEGPEEAIGEAPDEAGGEERGDIAES